MKLIIVDDNVEFITSLDHFLTKRLKLKVLATYTNGYTFNEELSDYDADIILMDISMPEIDGYETARLAVKENPNIRIIAITMFDDKAYLKKLLEYGFKGCVFKNKIFSELHNALISVNKGEVYFSHDK